MSYTVINKPGGHRKIWAVKEGKVLIEFDKDNKAVVDNKATADKLKKLGYTVTENKVKSEAGEADGDKK